MRFFSIRLPRGGTRRRFVSGQSFLFFLFFFFLFFFVDVSLIKRVSIERNVEDTTMAFRAVQRARSARKRQQREAE